MAKVEKENKLPPAVDSKVNEELPVEAAKLSVSAETPPASEEKEELKTLPKIRIKVEEEAEKVKRFATAQSLSMHMKVNKAKKAGLTAMHKVATWLTPNKK